MKLFIGSSLQTIQYKHLIQIFYLEKEGFIHSCYAHLDKRTNIKSIIINVSNIISQLLT